MDHHDFMYSLHSMLILLLLLLIISNVCYTWCFVVLTVSFFHMKVVIETVCKLVLIQYFFTVSILLMLISTVIGNYSFIESSMRLQLSIA